MKISRITIIVAAVVIVVVLAGSLGVGLGFIGGKSKGSTVVTTVLVPEIAYTTATQIQGVTQTLLSTVSLPQTTSTLTTTQTSFSISKTTLQVPTTVNVTHVENSTITQTIINNITTTASGYVVLYPAGTKFIFTSGQKVVIVNQQILRPGFNGFYDITFQTNLSTPVHWVVEGNNVNESSFSAPSGDVNLPVHAFVQYTISVYNDACRGFCTNAFNVTASIVYEY